MTENKMKIQTINIKKGGTGKSSIAFNYSSYLATVKNKKVLIIDGDNSCNLSYSLGEVEGKTIFDLFENGETEIVNIKENIDIIFGSEDLTDDDLNLKSKQNNVLQLFMWFVEHKDELEKKYDYVIIDTHNDESLVTANFIAVADQVFAICNPSKNSWRAWQKLKNWIDDLKSTVIEPVSKAPYISAKPYLIGNIIEFVGNNMPRSSSNFIDIAVSEENYLGFIPKKELITASLLNDQSIYEQLETFSPKKKVEHEKFYRSINAIFEKMSEL